MIDTHVHTTFSTDSRMTIEEAIRVSKEKNIGLILTEHMDMNCPEPGKFVFDVDKYFREYYSYRNDNLLLGIEIGLTEAFKTENIHISKEYPFDYVLGSIHFLRNYDIYYPEYYFGKSKREAYEDYLITMAQNIQGERFFDSLGHIDYICRYSPYEDKDISMEEYGEFIDEVLRSLIESDIVMEINTRRLNSKGAAEKLLAIYYRYRELGGRYVTIGSDSHYPEAIGFNFGLAYEIAERSSLIPVYFKNRKMEYL